MINKKCDAIIHDPDRPKSNIKCSHDATYKLIFARETRFYCTRHRNEMNVMESLIEEVDLRAEAVIAKIQSLANEACKQINNKSNSIFLILPYNKSKRRRRLAGKNSPWGEIVADSADDPPGVIVKFKADDILAWCINNGAVVNMVLPDGREMTSGEFKNLDE